MANGARKGPNGGGALSSDRPCRRPLAAAARQVAPRRGLGVSSVFQEAREALGGPARIHEHTTKGPRGALELRSTQLSELTRIYLCRWIFLDFATIVLAF